MKSKEAIRKKIIHYANLTWGVNNINNLNPLIHLMVEEVCHELYLLDNKLNDVDATILEELSTRLAPVFFSYIRPAHAILYAKPAISSYHLSKKTEFSLKSIPAELKSKNTSSVSFTSVTDVKLINASITNIFYNRTLWATDHLGNKSLVGTSLKKTSQNTVWVKLEIAPDVKVLQNLFFYLDFPHLNDSHSYYDVLPTVKWSIAGKELKIKQGMPLLENSQVDMAEQDILDLYKDHYQTLQEPIDLDRIPKEKLPAELVEIMSEEVVRAIVPGYWFGMSFPPLFGSDDIEKMLILINALPVLNRRYNESRSEGQNLTNVISLSSGIAEEFLAMDTIIDSLGNQYALDETQANRKGVYSVASIRKKKVEDPRVVDYLTKLVDVIQEERSAFPHIDQEQIMEVINSISAIQDEDTLRIELNRLNDYAQVGRLHVNLHEGITYLDTSYWTTYVEHVNGLSSMTTLSAGKIPELNKSDAVLLTSVSGGRSFYDIDSLKAINRYFLTSKDRISTKHNILSFCRMEIGKYIQEIDVVRKAQISPKAKQGIMNVMEIQITPKGKYVEYINAKEVIKDLRIRLKRRSPDNYDYTFKIIEPSNEKHIN